MSDLYIFGYSSGPSAIDISSATVTLGSSLTYNGTEQTQTVSVEVDGVTLTENTDYTITDNTATNAGSYTLSILGTGAYSGTKTASWSIAKAQGSISVNPSSLTIVGANSTGTATITSVGDGVISAVSSDASVATVAVSGNTVTVTSVASGSAIVTVTLADGQNYLGDSTTVSVSVMVISSTLANCTPSEIQAAAQAGVASTLWSVGDCTSEIAIGAFGDGFSGANICAFILGFDHNSALEGTGIHFQIGKTVGGIDVVLCDSGYNTQKSSGTWFNMNNSSTNTGGWSSCSLRNNICPALFSAIPLAWQKIISTATKYTDNVGGGSSINAVCTATEDKIWIPSAYEVFGTLINYQGTQNVATSEASYCVQYDYYINGNGKIRYKHDATSTATWWWLRSPHCSNNTFCDGRAQGTLGQDNARYSLGFAPAFRVA